MHAHPIPLNAIRAVALPALFITTLSVQAGITNTPQLMEMWRSGEPQKLAYVLGYVSGVLDKSTIEDGFCLEAASGKTPTEVVMVIMRQTESDYERRLTNLRKVEKAIGTKAPAMSAADHVIMSARQIYSCK